MSYIIAGLGNPGEEYLNTRHNCGRIMLMAIAAANAVDPGDFSMDKKLKSLVAKGTIGSGKKKEKVTFVMPETFMNNSGKAIGPLVTSISGGVPKANLKKAAELAVIYDDFNLPLGKIRISFNRSSGGHNGLESIIRSAKTEAFLRIRIGVAPETAKGLAKVPHGDDKIEKFILGKFTDQEMKEIKKVAKTVVEAVTTLVIEGKEKAMSLYNAG